MTKKTILLWLIALLFLLPRGIAERETTDIIIIIRVPAIVTPGMIKPDRPAGITALRKESDNLYDPVSETFICIMTVAEDKEAEILALIATLPTKEAEKITAEKEAAIKLVFSDFDDRKAQVEENVEFAGETEEEWKSRKGIGD